MHSPNHYDYGLDWLAERELEEAMHGTSVLIIDGKAVGFAEVELEKAATQVPEHFTAFQSSSKEAVEEAGPIDGKGYTTTMTMECPPGAVAELLDALRPKTVDIESFGLFDVVVSYALDPRGWMPVFDMDGRKTVRVTKHGVELLRHGCRIDIDFGKEG